MICTILTLNVKTHELNSAVIKDDNIHPNKALAQVNQLVNDINKNSKNVIVLGVNITLVDIWEKQIENKLTIEFKD